MRRPVVLLLVAILLSVSASAAEPYWNGARSQNWSDPANWTPARLPAPSELVEFPGWPGRRIIHFDLPDGTPVGPMAFLGEYVLAGNRMKLTADWSVVSSPSAVAFTVDNDLELGANVRLRQMIIARYNGGIDVSGKTLTIDTYNTHVYGPIQGDGTIEVLGLGLNVHGEGSFRGTINGRVNVVGSYPNATFVSKRLSGTGTLGTVNAALLSPGDWPPPLNSDTREVGTLHTGPLSITSSYVIDLVPAGPYDQVYVKGPVSVAGTLQVHANGTFAPGWSYKILDNDGSDAVSGTFEGLAEGAAFTAGSTAFRITYRGGDGNDIVLNAFGNPTSTTLAASRDNTKLHEPVTFAATVTAPGGVPAGDVQFYDDSQLLASAPLSDGVATFTTSTLPPGTRIITARYRGNASFGGSTSPALHHGVYKHAPLVSVTTSPAASAYGDSVAIQVKVAAEAGVTDPITGTVSLNIDMSPSGLKATVAPDGTAIIHAPRLAAGSRGFMVVYSGNAYFASGTAQTTHKVARGATQTLVTSQSNPSQTGAPVLLDVRVVSTAHPELTVDGVVQVFAPGMNMAIAQALLVNGAVTIRIDGLAAGEHELQVAYAGGASFDRSSITWTQKVGTTAAVATTTTLAQNRESSNLHQPVTFTATVSSSNGVPTGSAAFLDGAQTIGSATLQNGVATFTTSSLSAGSHSIRASYAGGDGFAASSSAAVTHTVVKHNPHVRVTSSAIAYGADATFAIAVSADAGVNQVPSGSVTLQIGGTTEGTAVLAANGSAMITVPLLAPGAHAMTVLYSGDATFNAASGSTTQQVAKAATSIALESLVNPSQVGDAVLLQVRVVVPANPQLTATGMVQIASGGNVLAQAQLADGAATIRVESLAAGTHQLQALYAGMLNFEASASATLTQRVRTDSLPATVVTLTQNRESTNFHQPVTFTATVTAVSGVPTGSVTFYDGNAVLDTATLKNGEATLTVKTLNPGAHTITAKYSGSDTFAAGTSAPLVHAVIKHNPHGTISASPSPATYGDTVTFAISFEAAAGVSEDPRGEVTLTIDGTRAATATLSSAGTTSIAVPMLAAGTHSVVANYSGDNSFNAATASMTLTVNRAGTTVAIEPSRKPVPAGVTIAVDVRVIATAHPALPVDGAVALLAGGTVIAQAQLVNGVATLRDGSLPAGEHQLTATYSGNANFAAASSTTLTQHVGRPLVAAAAMTVVEGHTPHDDVIQVELNAAATQLVTVDYRTIDGTATAGSDYAAAQGTLTFAPGQTSATIPLRILGDTAVEPEETLTLALTNAIGATIATARTTIEITNDDTSHLPAVTHTYATVDGVALHATVFAPVAAEGPRPAILWIPGNGAYDASDEEIPAIRQTARGYAVVRLSYRAPAQAAFPAQIHDLQTAVRWLRANAATLNLDPNRFTAWGAGAGGHLAALLGTGIGSSNDRDSRVQAVIDWSGIADPAALHADALDCSTIDWNASTSPVSQLIGCSVTQCPASAEAAAPARYAGAGDAAMLLVHGRADCFVSPLQSQRLYDSLKRAGVDATLRVYDSVGHGGAFWTSAAAFADIDAFLDRTSARKRSVRH